MKNDTQITKKEEKWMARKKFGPIHSGLGKMCLWGAFCSSLQGKKETSWFKSLKSSFTEIHVYHISYTCAGSGRITSSLFWKHTRRSPPLVSLQLSPSLRTGPTNLAVRTSPLESEAASPREGRGALWHTKNQSDDCKYLFVNHLFHSVSSRSAIRLWHAG